MRRQILALVGVAGVGMLLLGGSRAYAQVELGPMQLSDAASEWDRLLAVAGISENWRRFFVLEARKESRFVSNVFLGLPNLQPPKTVLSPVNNEHGASESLAAKNLYRATPYLHNCPWGEDRYSVGGGVVGLLGANAVRGYKGTSLECIDPWAMFDIREAVPMAYGHALRLYENRSPKTWLEMASAWGIPGETHNPDRLLSLRKKLAKHLEALHIPPAWLDMAIEPLPRQDLVAMRALVLGAVGYAASKYGAYGEPAAVEVPFGHHPVVNGGISILWLHCDIADRDLIPGILEHIDGDGYLISACVESVSDCMSAIEEASSTHGPVVVVAIGRSAGWALAAGCASQERVQLMYLADPVLPECFDVHRSVATMRAWVTKGCNLRGIGLATAAAARAGVHVLSVSSASNGDPLSIWSDVIDAMSKDTQ